MASNLAQRTDSPSDSPPEEDVGSYDGSDFSDADYQAQAAFWFGQAGTVPSQLAPVPPPLLFVQYMVAAVAGEVAACKRMASLYVHGQGVPHRWVLCGTQRAHVMELQLTLERTTATSSPFGGSPNRCARSRAPTPEGVAFSPLAVSRESRPQRLPS